VRIDRLHIDGFGRAVDSDLILGEGLTLIRGANGTGKTTVHQFVHGIFYGLVKDAFPLVRGGRRGGVISGVLADGRPFEVSRHGDPVSGANQRLEVTIGGEGPGSTDERLRLVVGGVTKHVFETVFAFGQDELRDFRRLTNEDVANRIYGASIGVIGDVLKIEANLMAELDALWKPRGANPAINQGLTTMNSLRQRLAARDLPTEYGDLRRTIGEVEARRSQIETEITLLDERRQELARLLAARVPWQTMVATRARLGGMADEPSVTAEELAEEARLAQAVRIAGQGVGSSRLAREQLDEQLVGITYRADVLDRAPEIDEAVSTASNWRSREADLTETRRRSTLVRAATDAVLVEAGWDQGKLRAFEPSRLKAGLSTHGREDLDTPQRNLGAPSERARAAAAEVQRHRATTSALDEQAVELAAGDLEDAEVLEHTLHDLETDLARADTLRRSLSAAQTPAPETASRVTPPVIPAARPSWLSPGLAVGVGVAAVVVGVLLAVVVAPVPGILVAGAGSAVGGWIWWTSRAGTGQQASVEAPVHRQEVDHPMAAELRNLETSIGAQWASVGLQPPPTIAGLGPVRSRLDRARQTKQAREALDRDRQRAATELRAAITEWEAATAALAAAQSEVDAGAVRWATFLSSAGLPSTIDRDGAADLISRLEGAQADLQEAATLGQTIGKTERERLLWVEGVRRLASDLKVPSGDDVNVVVERLRQELAAARTNSRSRDALVQRRDEAGRVEREAAATLGNAQAAHAALLASHGVPDGEALAARHARGAARASVVAELAQAEATFRDLVPEAARANVESELRRSDAAATAHERDQINGRITALAAGRDSQTAAEATLQEQLRRLRAEADTSAIRQELADRRAALESHGRRWLVLRTALELLRETRSEYEERHRPAVLARAETLFMEWTAGEYSGFDRLSESGLEAVVSASDGKRVPLAGLSRGTAEQLYLAMRIALVEHLATRQEPLPLVMDDVLVNFDPTRAQRVARTIEDVARTRQVIYLTCHREVALRPTRTLELGPNVEVVPANQADTQLVG
jgi:uncharacterized protein YhaN